jgi:hypothetical protein
MPRDYSAAVGMELYILITDLALFLGLIVIVWQLDRQRRDHGERFREGNEILQENVHQIIHSLEMLSADAKKAQEWQYSSDW